MAEPLLNAQPSLDLLGQLSARLSAWARPERSFIDALLEEMHLESGLHVLDVGCGTGALLAAAAYKEPGAVLVGVDPDEDALELASRKLPRTTVPVELRQGVGEELPFPAGCFDVVTVTLLLRRLPPAVRRDVLRECHRVLAPAGRLLIADWAAEPGGLASVVAMPVNAVRRFMGGTFEEPRIEDQIVLAGFDAPDRARTFYTVGGTIEILVARAATARG